MRRGENGTQSALLYIAFLAGGEGVGSKEAARWSFNFDGTRYGGVYSVNDRGKGSVMEWYWGSGGENEV